VERTLAPFQPETRSGAELIETLDVFFASNGNLSEAARRLHRLVPWRNILVVTNVEHVQEVADQLPQLGREQILVEPVGRNTLPCIALANEWILQRHAEALVIVAPADHLILDVDGFQKTVLAAEQVAATQPALVTIGVPPTQGGVITGWTTGLVVAKAGSRIMLTIPPKDGYGSKGDSQAGIKGTDTLVFVVDVLGSFSKGA